MLVIVIMTKVDMNKKNPHIKQIQGLEQTQGRNYNNEIF